MHFCDCTSLWSKVYTPAQQCSDLWDANSSAYRRHCYKDSQAQREGIKILTATSLGQVEKAAH